MTTEFWDGISLARRLYARAMEPLLHEHRLTRVEFDVLLFLANNPVYDTATDIVMRRGLTKSHVSSAVNSLAAREYLRKSLRNGNRKVIHLEILPAAAEIIADGQAAQRDFFERLIRDLTPAERHAMLGGASKLTERIRALAEEEL